MTIMRFLLLGRLKMASCINYCRLIATENLMDRILWIVFTKKYNIYTPLLKSLRLGKTLLFK